MSVAQAQREIDAAEYAEWLAFHQRDPIGPERLDIHIARILAQQFNIHRDPRKQPPKDCEDCMPQWGGPIRKTAAEIKSKLMAISAAIVGHQKAKEARRGQHNR